MMTQNLYDMRRPVLLFLAKRPRRHLDIKQELAPAIAEQLNLAEEKNSSHGRSDMEFFLHLVALACSRLSEIGLVEKTESGCARITQEGKYYVDGHHGTLNEIDLVNSIGAYKQWKARMGQRVKIRRQSAE